MRVREGQERIIRVKYYGQNIMAGKSNDSHTPGRLSRFQVSLGLLRSPFVLIPGLVIGIVSLGILYNYYVLYSGIIDQGLRGDLFVRTSGIYAAPLDLHRGSSMPLGTLLRHLQQLGYTESGRVQNEKRGFYRIDGTTIEIMPGGDAMIDGTQPFHNLRVKFGRRGEGIESIVDLDQQADVEVARIEPELISTLSNKVRERRKIIDYNDLPKYLVDGIVAIEDRQFFEHPGINWRGIVRALIKDYQAGAIREGGSSITQQLVKNIFLFPDRTWKRKLAEAYMSLILEQRLTKEEILAMYANQIYLGQRGGFSINGFGQAARTYFGKDISNLALHEAALLAGIIRSPNYYSPYSNEERARERRNLVLEKMVEAGRLDRTRAEAAKKERLGITVRALGVNSSDAPYFTDYLMRQLERLYEGDEQSLRSLRIYSTIDLDLQRAAYEVLTSNMARIEERIGGRNRSAGLQAALVALNAKTGEVLAMIGGRDYSTSQLNRATDARRQPGSVFKPFVYAAALEAGESGLGSAITAASLFNDTPQSFEYDGRTYQPGNFGDKYENRPLTVREALVSSKNVITVEIAQRIGYAQVRSFAERAGIANVPLYPSAALGVGEATPLQIAAAYSAFANEGSRVAPSTIRRLTTRDGATIFEAKTETKQVMSPELAFLMTSMMEDVLISGTGARVRQRGFDGRAAGKTGSSRDAWFAGYTRNLVCVVWIGYDNNSDIGLTGGETAAPIWADFMIQALRHRPDLGGEFTVPEGIERYEVDPVTGSTPSMTGGTTRTEYFLPGTSPGGQPLPDSYTPEPELNVGANSGSSAEQASYPSSIETPRVTPTPFRPSARGSAPVAPAKTERQSDRQFERQEGPIPGPSQNRSGPERSGGAAVRSEPGIWERVKKIVDTDRLLSGTIFSEKRDGSTAGRGDGDRPPSPPETTRKTTPAADESRPSGSEPGGFFVQVCERSGLLPIKNLCPTTRRRFSPGREPVNTCNPGFHR